MVMPLSGDSQCCLNKVKPPDDHEIRLQDVEHGKERPASERDFFRRGAGPVAVRFRFHVLEEYAVSHGIPHRVGPTVSVPGEHGGDVADVADPVVAVAFGGVLERPAHDPVSVRSVGSVRRRAVVGFADHEDTRSGVGVAVPHVGEEMDGLGFLQMLP